MPEACENNDAKLVNSLRHAEGTNVPSASRNYGQSRRAHRKDKDKLGGYQAQSHRNGQPA
eukprot:2861020-Pleurochrysis_carterae.AAC.3